MAKLLTANKVGILDQILGRGSDKEVAGNATNFENLLSSRGNAYNDAVHAHGANSPEAQAAKQGIQQLFANIDAYVAQQVQMRSGRGAYGADGAFHYQANGPVAFDKTFGDQTGNLAILQGLKGLTHQRRDQMGLEDPERHRS